MLQCFHARRAMIRAQSTRRRRDRGPPALEVLETRRLLAVSDLDLSFGTGGTATVPFNVKQVAVLSNEETLVAGTDNSTPAGAFALARYTVGGQLDATFGTAGVVKTSFGTHNADATKLLLQADGKYIVVGEFIGEGFGFPGALARYNSDGSLDTMFGTAGTVVVPGGPSYAATYVASIRDGALWLSNGYSIIHLTGQGMLDSSFGMGGSVSTADYGDLGIVESGVFQSDGKLLVAGGGANVEGFVRRLNVDGTIDTSFGTNGTQLVKVGTYFQPRINALAIQPNGDILVAGWSNNYGPIFGDSGGVTRLHSDGTLAYSSFIPPPPTDSRGTFTLHEEFVQSLAMLPTNVLVLGGAGTKLTIGLFWFVTPQDGVIISSTGTTTVAGATTLGFQALGAAPDGRFVAVGQIGGQNLVARFQGVEDAIVPMHRAYNPDPTHPVHVFTTSDLEFQSLLAAGWHDESSGPPTFDVSLGPAPGLVPLHRIYNRGNGQHYYTTSDGERDALIALPHSPDGGWFFEKEEGYVHPGQDVGTQPLYVLYNTQSGDHLYVINAGERTGLLQMFPGIWVDTTPAGFAMIQAPSSSVAATSLASEHAAEVPTAAASVPLAASLDVAFATLAGRSDLDT